MTASLLAIACFATVLTEVELTTLSGETETGEITGWTAESLTIGELEMPLASVHTLRFSDRSESIGDAARVIEFVDGSTLPVVGVTRESDTISFQHAGSQYEVSASRVRALRFAPLEDRLSSTWSELVSKDQRDDVFARVRGESLDHVKCIVGDLTDSAVDVRVGSRDVSVPIDKVFGLVLANDRLNSTRIAAKVFLVDGGTLVCSQVQWSDGLLRATAVAGFTLTAAPDRLAEVDLAAGRLALLHDLEPRSVSYDPFGDNYDDYAWQFRRNSNALGERLRVGGKRYAKGLWIHSGTTVTFAMPPRTRRLQATVGIDELEVRGVPVELEVLADGRTIFESVIDPETPQQLDLDVADARTLTLVAKTTNPDGHGIREQLAIVGGRIILE